MLCSFDQVQLRWPNVVPWDYCVSGRSPSVKSAHFSVETGDLIWLFGANGVGKSTWMRLVAGLLPMSGDISWCARVTPCSLVHGFFRPSLPSLDECVTCDLMISREYLCRMQSMIPSVLLMDLLSRFGLLSVRHYPIHALSSGQRLRLSLVPLCYTRQAIWLLDEPFSHLDMDACQLIRSSIAMHRARGGVVFLASHVPVVSADKSIELTRSCV